MVLKRGTLFLLFLLSVSFAEIKVRGAELASKDQLLYGRFEVRMQTAEGKGILSTFFTYESDGWMPNSGNPWRELDIEVLGRYTDQFQTNIITGTAEKRITSEFFPKVISNPASGYHTYAIEWTPDYVAFLFDGEVMRKTEANDAKKQITDCRDIPQSYRFNFWANAISSWVGAFDASILPRYQFVNWIKYYKYSTSNKSFTLDWTDNFDSFNSSRWSKSTHTIEDFTQFSAANIIFKDGTLILAMTDLSGNGLSNITVPPDVQTEITEKRLSRKSKKKFSIKMSGKWILCSLEPSMNRTVSYVITDMYGRTVSESTVFTSGNSSFSIPLGSTYRPDGMYIIRVKTDTGIYSHVFTSIKRQ
ncbi:MAG: family 16 glycosylhydrolase [Chitinispirillaceae bacterium]|nr:family 16 glycosylhydrolase [Chitinispirillaceae bacterium]